MFVLVGPLQDQGTSVGGLLPVPRPQSQEAGAGGRGNGTLERNDL